MDLPEKEDGKEWIELKGISGRAEIKCKVEESTKNFVWVETAYGVRGC